MTNVIVVEHPLIATLLTRLRDKTTHSEEFSNALHLIGLQLILAATANLLVGEVQVTTPLQVTVGHELADSILFAPVLRAGLGFVRAAQMLYPASRIQHLGMYRDEQKLEPVLYYNKLGDGQLDADVGIILDPMLATGGSVTAAVEILKAAGVQNIKVVCLIAAPEGLFMLQEAHPDVVIYTAAVDEGLNEIGFIVPGLGDAGDRQFNT